jgi:hypothetical protein
VTSLKEFRHDLTDHLAEGLGATAPKLGAQVNPPAVIVSSGSPYLTASDYCNDAILFAVTIVTAPGDPPAVIDALDDMLDLVRSTTRRISAGGHRYAFREVSGFVDFAVGDDAILPAVVVTIGIERSAP